MWANPHQHPSAWLCPALQQWCTSESKNALPSHRQRGPSVLRRPAHGGLWGERSGALGRIAHCSKHVLSACRSAVAAWAVTASAPTAANASLAKHRGLARLLVLYTAQRGTTHTQEAFGQFSARRNNATIKYVCPNPSVEPTAPGKPVSAAHLKRWASCNLRVSSHF